MEPLVWYPWGGLYWTERINFHGFDARWVCDGKGQAVLWVFDPGDDITPGGCDPIEERPCDCPKCKEKAARADEARAA